jgi:putative copper resistance protein D
MDDPLIWWRAIHFAATLQVVGVVFFLASVAEPAFAVADKSASLPAAVRRPLNVLTWISLAVAVMSGAAWLIALAQQLSDGTVTAVLRDGIVWIVLTRTGFGTDWIVRLTLAVLLGACLPIGATPASLVRRSVGVVAAAGLVGSLAFAGHAAAGSGVEGIVHLLSDIVHLVAAAAWVGALVPLAMLLGAAGRSAEPSALAIAATATRRFSVLGVASVAALLVTGIVNTWVLVGSIGALVETSYGLLLLVKVALFLVMVAIAAVNRRVLTPQLVQEADVALSREALRRLCRNSLIEAVVAAVIIVIVGMLGTMPPASHDEVAVPALATL